MYVRYNLSNKYGLIEYWIFLKKGILFWYPFLNYIVFSWLPQFLQVPPLSLVMLLLQFFPLRLFLQPANPHFGHLYKTPPQCEPSAFPEQFAILLFFYPYSYGFSVTPRLLKLFLVSTFGCHLYIFFLNYQISFLVVRFFI